MEGTFEQFCPYCRGQGDVINPKFIEWQLNNFNGPKPDNAMIKCPMCNGVCIIPSELGEEILNLCKDYKYNEDGEDNK